MPLLALPLFYLLPFAQALLYYGLILAASGFVYQLILRDMRKPTATGAEGMIGGVGRVMDHRAGKIKILYRGEIWDAVCGEKVGRDDAVEITGLQRMYLIVRKH
jgi:membrane-bound ClpP family serine protease